MRIESPRGDGNTPVPCHSDTGYVMRIESPRGDGNLDLPRIGRMLKLVMRIESPRGDGNDGKHEHQKNHSRNEN